MRMSRRDFLKLAGATGIAAALPFSLIEKALAGNGDPRVIWLQGQSCTGCSVSLLNSVNLTTIDDVLLNKINLEYHSNLIASAGDVAMTSIFGAHPGSAELAAMSEEWLAQGPGLAFDVNQDGRVDYYDLASLARQGYILVVEGAIPSGADGRYCGIGHIAATGHELTILEAFDTLSSKADAIIGIGTCACYGGIPAALPNPTTARGVSETLSDLGRTATVINIPGCPAHPDWFVGTVVKLLAGQSVALDTHNRPLDYFEKEVHKTCPLRGTDKAKKLGDPGCLDDIGCKGKRSFANCPSLKWNNPGQNQAGVNWCIQARVPCHGCTEPGFPDSMTPFHQDD